MNFYFTFHKNLFTHWNDTNVNAQSTHQNFKSWNWTWMKEKKFKKAIIIEMKNLEMQMLLITSSLCLCTFKNKFYYKKKFTTIIRCITRLQIRIKLHYVLYFLHAMDRIPQAFSLTKQSAIQRFLTAPLNPSFF